MPARKLIKAAAATLVAGAAITGGVALSAPASADTNEDVFIAAVDHQGISYTTEANMINLGHKVCNAFDAGATPQMIAMTIYRSSPWSAYDSGYVTGASVSAFCPQYTSVVLAAAA